LAIPPAYTAVAGGTSPTFTATGTDQFGNTITSPGVTWSVTGGGSIDSSLGIYSTSQTGGNYTITAVGGNLQSGTLQTSTGVTVVPTIFSGSSGNDSYTLSLNPSNTSQDQLVVSISGSGTVTYNIAASSYPSLTINPSAGNDTLTVSFANGNPLPAGGVTFTGGANVSGNALYIQGVAAGGLAFSVNSANVTDMAAPSSPINYSNLGKLEFDLSGGANSLTQLAQPAAPLTYNAGSGSNTLNVSGGTYTFSTDPQIADGSLTVNDNTSVIFTAAATSSGINARHLAALNVGPGATAVAQSQGTTDHVDRLVLMLGAMSLNATGQFDLGDNDVLLHSSAANRAADMTRVNGYLKTGFNGGLWNGLGLASAIANSAAGDLNALGLILNDDGSNPGGVGNPLITPFDGQTPMLATDLLVKYTYYGDATLDGKVDGSDYSRIDTAMITPSSTGWHNGDFNYDGVINGSDYTLIDNAFNVQGAKLTAAIASEIASNAWSHPSNESSLLTAQGTVSANATTFASQPAASVDDLLDGWKNQRHGKKR